MKKIIVLMFVAIGATALLAADTQSSALVARGKKLSMTSGCNDCHTPGFFYGAPDMTRAMSGSELGWVGPWGETFAPNITPDVDTGIGKWSADQIATAIRHGIAPNKEGVLRPPMPWQDFANFSDDDVNAIVAYLKSIPAVHHVTPAALPPGAPPQGSYFKVPPPPAWDAPKTGASGSDSSTPRPTKPSETTTSPSDSNPPR